MGYAKRFALRAIRGANPPTNLCRRDRGDHHKEGRLNGRPFHVRSKRLRMLRRLGETCAGVMLMPSVRGARVMRRRTGLLVDCTVIPDWAHARCVGGLVPTFGWRSSMNGGAATRLVVMLCFSGMVAAAIDTAAAQTAPTGYTIPDITLSMAAI